MKTKKTPGNNHRKYYDIYEFGEFKRRAKNDEDALMGWVDASTKNLYTHKKFIEAYKNHREIDGRIFNSIIVKDAPVLIPFDMIADGFHYTNSDGNNKKMCAYADALEAYFEASGLSDELAGWKGALYQLFRSITSTDINMGILCGEIGYFKMMFARATANDVFMLFKKSIMESVSDLEKQKRITVKEAQLHEMIIQHKEISKSNPDVKKIAVIEMVLSKKSINVDGIEVDTSNGDGYNANDLRSHFDRSPYGKSLKKRKYNARDKDLKSNAKSKKHKRRIHKNDDDVNLNMSMVEFAGSSVI